MKHNILLLGTICSLALPLSALAEVGTVPEAPAEPALLSGDTGMTTQSAMPSRMEHRGMMHKGMMHKGMAGNGKGHGGGKHGGGHAGKNNHRTHAEVVKRLDLIEARLAKIEAMLETLVRR